MIGFQIRKGNVFWIEGLISVCLGNKQKRNFVPSLFGQPDTPYDYRDVNLGDAKKTLQQLVDKHEAMRKKINVKVMNMIDK
jgi:hypothetical protein